jgi:hypothetical protein
VRQKLAKSLLGLNCSLQRTGALLGSIVMVEIDYLHQTPPFIGRIPRYPAEGAYPYYILMTTPRPHLEEGHSYFYGFHIDQEIPIVPIPLLSEDVIKLDFGMIYNRTFLSANAFAYQVDYEQDPPRIETYSPDDQQRIRARMKAVLHSVVK